MEILADPDLFQGIIDAIISNFKNPIFLESDSDELASLFLKEVCRKLSSLFSSYSNRILVSSFSNRSATPVGDICYYSSSVFFIVDWLVERCH